jgi:hypothetical protein
MKSAIPCLAIIVAFYIICDWAANAGVAGRLAAVIAIGPLVRALWREIR